MKKRKEVKGKLKYRKIGGGSFLFIDDDGKKQHIKPGQTFYASPGKLSEAQLTRCECLTKEGEKLEAKAQAEKPKPKQKPPTKPKPVKPENEPKKLKDKKVPELKPGEKPKAHNYEKKKRGGGWYNIVDDNGKKLNEKALKSADADEMLKTLKEV